MWWNLIKDKIHYSVVKLKKKWKKNKSEETNTFLQSCLSPSISRNEILINSVDESKIAAARQLVERLSDWNENV